MKSIHRIIGSALALSTLAGCSSASDSARQPQPDVDRSTSSDHDRSEDTDGGRTSSNDGQSTRTGTLQFHLPENAEPPPGYRMLKDLCSNEDNPSIVPYAVPTEWEADGWGRAGSGGTLDGSIDHKFRAPNGRVAITVKADSRDDDDNILNDSRELDEAYDYSVTIGEKKVEVVYDKAFNATIDGKGQQVWVTDHDQSDSLSDGEEFKVRVPVYEYVIDDSQGRSMSVTITAAAPNGVLTREVLSTILGSLHLSGCGRTAATVTLEVVNGVDLDGDGVVSTVDDLMAL